MRMLMAIAFLCALMIGANQAVSSSPTLREGQPPMQRAIPAELRLDDTSQYICQPPGTPLCQKASQCIAYCAGGALLCFQGCCSCAS